MWYQGAGRCWTLISFLVDIVAFLSSVRNLIIHKCTPRLLFDFHSILFFSVHNQSGAKLRYINSMSMRAPHNLPEFHKEKEIAGRGKEDYCIKFDFITI